MPAFTRYRTILAIVAIHALAACRSNPARCDAIEPGTPLSSLPVSAGSPCGGLSSNPDVAAIQCCLGWRQTDAGCGTDCAALAPYGSAAVGGDYSGDECSPYGVGWSCEVWYRNGKVVEAGACCID